MTDGRHPPDGGARDPAGRPVLVTGGAGFIGTNLADRLLRSGERVIVYDDLSRSGVDRNIAWLKAAHGDRVELERADLLDGPRLSAAVARAGCVFHLAAQVAVTTGLADPARDFDVNAAGTVRLLEAVRACPAPPAVVFTSTNKVYGDLADVGLVEEADRYRPADPRFGLGVGEERGVDFRSPYGCSKGAADQYVVDYSRSYGLDTCVFRMSCIYGPHQFGTEDQGWVAHFMIAAMDGRPITIYGTGKQVRDILYVDDLVRAFLLARRNIRDLRGRAFNIGGGPANAVSLLEAIGLIAGHVGRMPRLLAGPWRPADQPWYVSDTRSFRALTGWAPEVPAAEGIGRLHRWFRDGRPEAPLAAAPVHAAGR